MLISERTATLARQKIPPVAGFAALLPLFLAVASCVWQADYEQLGREKSQLAQRIRTLEGEILEKSKQETELRAELKSLDAARREADTRVRNSNQNLSRTREALRSREHAVESLEQRIARLQATLKTLRETAATTDAEKQAQIDEHLRTIAALQREQNAAQLTLERLRLDLAQAKRAETLVTEQRQALQKLGARVAQLVAAQTGLRGQNELLEQKVVELEEAATALAGKRDQLASELDELATTLAQRDLRVAELQKRSAELWQDRERLAGELAAASAERDATATQLAEVTTALEKSKGEKEQAVAALSATQEELTKKITALTAEKSVIGARYEQATAAYEREVHSLREQIAKEKSRTSRLQEEKEQAVAAQASRLTQEIQNISGQLAAARTERDTAAAQLTEVKDVLEKTRKEKEQAVTALSTREGQLTQQIDQLTVQRNEAAELHEQAAANYEQQVLALRAQVADKETDTRQLQEESRTVKQELDALKQTAAEVDENKRRVQAELASQQAVIESLRKQLAEREDPSSKGKPTITRDSTEQATREQEFQGQIVYNPPRQMTVGKSERIEVRIGTPDATGITESFKGRGASITKLKEISTFMKVTLEGDSFEVSSRSEAEQMVRQSGFTQWDFDVLPLASGSQMLHLKIVKRILLPDSKEEKISLPVIDASIDVEVNPVYTTASFLQTYWQWIIGTIIGSGFVGWAYGKIRSGRRTKGEK